MTILAVSVLLSTLSICACALSLRRSQQLKRLTDELSAIKAHQPFDMERAVTLITHMRRTQRGNHALLSVIAASFLLNVALTFWPGALGLS